MQASNTAFFHWIPRLPEYSPSSPIVRLQGDYDSFSTPSLWSEIERAIGGDGSGLILDAGEVTFFDASGIHVLVMAAEALAAKSETLILHQPSRCVERVLTICGLEALGRPTADLHDQ